MTQMITSWHSGQRKAYCVECADSLPEVQAELEKAEDEDLLEISNQPEDAQGEECTACHRQISQVRDEPRSYRMKVTITFECEIWRTDKFNLSLASRLRAAFLTP